MRAQARIHHAELPPDTSVAGLHFREGLSEQFDGYVELLTERPEVDVGALLWSTVAVTVVSEAADSAPRSFHGVIEEARDLGPDHRLHRYGLRIRPAVHGLKYRVRTRVFQELSAVEIIQQVLEGAGIPAESVRWDTQGQYAPREYCTQWKESELDFVLRLLEHEGIYYWFEHSDVDHVLCFGDSPTSYTDIVGQTSLTLQRDADQRDEALRDIIQTSALTYDAYQSRDFYFETPSMPLQAREGEGGERRLYEYPGGYHDPTVGTALATARLDAQWADTTLLEATSTCLRLAPCRRFELHDVLPEPLIGGYVVRHIEHRLDQGAPADGRGGQYSAKVVCHPDSTPFRPSRTTPRPVASGLESAVVTGPAGEEIHVDHWGRIKVHFYWDRENPVDDTASCWVRFQQLNTQGAMVLPRLGWEVHVAFENGDPDRPLALHKAYNQETMPPYGLPGNKTQSALQSSTSPGGGSTNEIRLQDGSGGMEWFMHASKDLNVTVANNHDETVGVDSSEKVGNVRSCTVGGSETGSIGGNQDISVSANSAEETGASKTVSIGGNDDWGTPGTFAFDTGGDRSETIGGMMNVLANEIGEQINGSMTRSVGAVQAIVSATAIAETVGGSKSETVGAAKAVITPKSYSESVAGTKSLLSGAITIKTGGDVAFGAKGAIAVTSGAVIDITCGETASFTGSQVRVTSGSATLKGGGGTFTLGGSITIDAKQFGGKGGPFLQVKGSVNYDK